MRYLVPASDVHDRLDQVVVPSVAKDADPHKEVRSTGSRYRGERFADSN